MNDRDELKQDLLEELFDDYLRDDGKTAKRRTHEDQRRLEALDPEVLELIVDLCRSVAKDWYARGSRR